MIIFAPALPAPATYSSSMNITPVFAPAPKVGALGETGIAYMDVGT